MDCCGFMRSNYYQHHRHHNKYLDNSGENYRYSLPALFSDDSEYQNYIKDYELGYEDGWLAADSMLKGDNIWPRKTDANKDNVKNVKYACSNPAVSTKPENKSTASKIDSNIKVDKCTDSDGTTTSVFTSNGGKQIRGIVSENPYGMKSINIPGKGLLTHFPKGYTDPINNITLAKGYTNFTNAKGKTITNPDDENGNPSYKGDIPTFEQMEKAIYS